MKLKNLYKGWSNNKRAKFDGFVEARLNRAAENHRRQGERRSTDYELYRHRKLGHVEPGQAKVVSSNTLDTVEAIMPDLMDILGPPDVVQIGPEKKADLDSARHNQRIWEYQQKHELDWFAFLYSWMKTALIYGDAYAEYGWENRIEYETKEYANLSFPDAVKIVENGGEIVSGQKVEGVGFDGQPLLLGFTEVITREKEIKRHGPFVEALAPEDIIIDEGAVNISKADFAARIFRTNLDTVLKEGRQRGYIGLGKLVADVKSQNTGHSINSGGSGLSNAVNRERQARFEQMDMTDPAAEGMDGYSEVPGLTHLDIYRIYTYWDVDGKGELSPVMAYYVPYNGQILAVFKNPYGQIPIESITPVPDPHQPSGISIPQLTEQSQRIMTALLRGILDVIKYGLHPVKLAETGRGTDLISLATAGPGDVITTNPGGLNSMKWLESPQLPPQVWNLIQWLESRDEKRTGITSYNQGTSSSSLNKTATGLSQILHQAYKRVTLMAHLIARGGLRRLVGRIIWMNQNFLSEEKVLYIASEGGELSINAEELKGQFNLSVNLSPGGGRQAQMESAQRIMQLLKQLVASPFGPQLVSPENMYHTAKLLLSAEGRHDLEKFLTEPKPPAPAVPVTPQQLTGIEGLPDVNGMAMNMNMENSYGPQDNQGIGGNGYNGQGGGGFSGQPGMAELGPQMGNSYQRQIVPEA